VVGVVVIFSLLTFVWCYWKVGFVGPTWQVEFVVYIVVVAVIVIVCHDDWHRHNKNSDGTRQSNKFE